MCVCVGGCPCVLCTHCETRSARHRVQPRRKGLLKAGGGLGTAERMAEGNQRGRRGVFEHPEVSELESGVPWGFQWRVGVEGQERGNKFTTRQRLVSITAKWSLPVRGSLPLNTHYWEHKQLGKITVCLRASKRHDTAPPAPAMNLIWQSCS